MDGRELKLFNERTMEAQFLRQENQFLRRDRDWLRVEMFHADRLFAELEERHARAVEENRVLQRRAEELTRKVAEAPGTTPSTSPPAFARANVPKRRRKRPGRKAGHAAALRPVPDHIDVRQDVPLPRDPAGRCCCPHCNCSLDDLREHERIVEDLVPQQVVVTAYRTRSGWRAMCRKRVESRAPEQPPAADLPHGQLGLDALATAATLRIVHRLPLRQVSRVLADLSKLRVCAGGIARQLQRLAGWLGPYYERLLLAPRASPRVHADETGWRTDGNNGFVWAVTDAKHTLYHVDKSRPGQVIEGLLGKAFGGTLVSDFYGAYARLDCKKQKCLAHLLREFVETAEKHPAFAAGALCGKGKRLIRDLLRLKARWDELDDDRYTSRACRLETRLDQLPATNYPEANEKRIAARMRRRRRELTAFLWDRHLDGTNNAAERALRPAVVARKISGGSRSGRGADAWAKLASLTRTADQQGRNVLAVVKQLLIEHWSGQPAMALLAGP